MGSTIFYDDWNQRSISILGLVILGGIGFVTIMIVYRAGHWDKLEDLFSIVQKPGNV